MDNMGFHNGDLTGLLMEVLNGRSPPGLDQLQVNLLALGNPCVQAKKSFMCLCVLFGGLEIKSYESE